MTIRPFNELMYAEKRYAFRASQAAVFSMAGPAPRQEVLSVGLVAALPDGIEYLFPGKGYDRYMLRINEHDKHANPGAFKSQTEKLDNNHVLVYEAKTDSKRMITYLIGADSITQLMQVMNNNFKTGLLERQAITSLRENTWPDFKQQIEKIDPNRWYLRD